MSRIKIRQDRGRLVTSSDVIAKTEGMTKTRTSPWNSRWDSPWNSRWRLKHGPYVGNSEHCVGIHRQVFGIYTTDFRVNFYK